MSEMFSCIKLQKISRKKIGSLLLSCTNEQKNNTIETWSVGRCKPADDRCTCIFIRDAELSQAASADSQRRPNIFYCRSSSQKEGRESPIHFIDSFVPSY